MNPQLASRILGALPMAVATLFVAMFSRAVPLTDDWRFLQATMAMESMDLLQAVRTVVSLQIYDHHVAVPMLIYMPVAYATAFDARGLIAVTLLSFLAQFLVYRTFILRSNWASVPVALLMFSTAHWMEMLWACELALALSVFLPMVGLLVVNRVDESDQKALVVIAGLSLILLGVLSAAGACFAYPAAFLLIVMSRMSRMQKLAYSSLALIAGAVAILALTSSSGHPATVGLRNIAYVLTALGSLFWGSPVGLTSFGPGFRSITGFLVLELIGVAVVCALRKGRGREIALPLSFVVFGGLTIAAVSTSRAYLGNWHLQFALPVVCGGYCCVYIAWQEYSKRVVPAAIALSLIAWLVATQQAFTTYGPEFAAYSGIIEQYMVHYDPAAPKPYPSTGGWDFDQQMADFLRAHHHPSFKP